MLVLVVIAGWALMFAVLFGMLIYLTVLRGRRQRRKQVTPGPPFAPTRICPPFWRRPGRPIRISMSSCCLMRRS